VFQYLDRRLLRGGQSRHAATQALGHDAHQHQGELGHFLQGGLESFSSSDSTRQFLRAVAVALRGASAIAAISPNISPGGTRSSGLPPRVSITSPSSSR
jgi:hypothetical protein